MNLKTAIQTTKATKNTKKSKRVGLSGLTRKMSATTTCIAFFPFVNFVFSVVN